MLRHVRQIYEVGPFRVDPVSRVLSRDGVPVALNPKAFEILLVLIEHSGQVITKDKLMGLVWPDTAVEENNLTRNISSLRKALGESPNEHRYIVTVPGRGYSFVASITEVPHIETLSEGHDGMRAVTPHEGAPASSLRPVERDTAVRSSRIPLKVALTLLVTAVVAATGVAVYHFINRANEIDTSSRQPQPMFRTTRLTVSGNLVTSAISHDGAYLAYVTKLSETQGLWVKQVTSPGSIRILEDAEQDYYSVAFSPGGEHLYYIARKWNEVNSALYRVPKLGGAAPLMVCLQADSFSISPDGRQIAYVIDDSESRLVVGNSDGSNPRQIATRKHPDFFANTPRTAPAWSPDGTTIACSVGRSDSYAHYVSLVGVRVADGVEQALTSKRWYSVGHLAWPRDDQLVFTGAEKLFAPDQLWLVRVPRGDARQLTNDERNYSSVSLTADARIASAVQTAHSMAVWIAPSAGSAGARRISAEVGYRNLLDGFSWTPDERLVYSSTASGHADIWVMKDDGSDQTRLTFDAAVDLHPTASPDGRYIVFSSDRAGVQNIWRMSSRGENPTRLTNGFGEVRPEISPDGNWVVYQTGDGHLWRVPLEGGREEPLVKRHAIRPAISPDGLRLAHFSMRDGKWGLEVSSIRDGTLLRRQVLGPSVNARVVRWTADGASLAYVAGTGGVSNIWALDPASGSTRQLTSFTSERISYFAWSRHGKLACSRGTETSDVVILDGLGVK